MCNNCGDCKNKVDQVVPSGYLSKVVQSPCGSTSIHGHELVCDECAKNCGRPWYICATCGRDCSEYDCGCGEEPKTQEADPEYPLTTHLLTSKPKVYHAEKRNGKKDECDDEGK